MTTPVRLAPPIEAEVWAALADVPDPEIPAVSMVDLGVVHEVAVTADAAGPRITVRLLPTFVGCPALDVMRDTVEARLRALAPAAEVTVAFTFAEPWTSDRITPLGRERLRASGFAPPGPAGDPAGPVLVSLDAPVACPWCGSARTRLESAFGPTQCRTVRYCPDCRQPFEAFKPI